MVEEETGAFAPGRTARGCLGSLVVASLVLALGVRALLPWALRHVGVRQAEEALDARVELADVDLSILAGEISLVGLRIAAAEAPDETRFAAERVVLGLDRVALFRGGLGLGRLALERPELLVDRSEDGAFSFGVEGFAFEEPAAEEPVAADAEAGE